MMDRPQTQRERFLFSFQCSLLFSLLAHAYRFLNPLFSHDSTMVWQSDSAWQISLGRFLQPLYTAARGKLCAPWLVGLLSSVFLALAVFLMLQLLNVRSRPMIVLLNGLFTANATVTLMHASYLCWSDMFTLSLLLSVLAVWLMVTFRGGELAAPILLLLSLSLYQAYFQTAVALLMVYFIKELLEGEKARSVLLRGINSVLSLLGGLGLYYLVFFLVQRAAGISAAHTYNGVAQVGDYAGISIPALLKNTWLHPLRSLLHPDAFHRKLVVLAALLLLVLTLAGLLWLVRKRALGREECLLGAALLLLLPLGMNVVYFISKGMEHALMTFSFLVPALLAAYVLERWQPAQALRSAALLRAAGAFLLAVIVACGCFYSNQVYLKKDLEERATLSLMTRVLDRVEQTEGYLPGQTPAVFIGALDGGVLSAPRPGFDYSGVGLNSSYSVTYTDTLAWYFRDVLGYKISLAPQDILEAYRLREDVKAMPAYPAGGSVSMVDGVLVVKLS